MVAPHVISFHYVSSMECALLYQLLSRSNTDPPPSEQQLRDMWPKNDKDAGHYARWRFHSDEESARLHKFLTTEVKVNSPTSCDSLSSS